VELIMLVIDLRLLCGGGGRDRVLASWTIVDHMVSEGSRRFEKRKRTEGAFTAKISHAGPQTTKWGRKISCVKSSLWRKGPLILKVTWINI